MPTPLGINLLYGLLGLFVLSNAAAIVFGKSSADGDRHSITWLQRSTSLQLAVMAWLFWGLDMRGGALGRFSLLIALGMSISFIADLIMAGASESKGRLLAGIAVFGAAHVVYLLAYVAGARELRAVQCVVFLGAALIMIVIALVIWYAFVRNPAGDSLLNFGALGYTVLIAIMVAGAGTLVYARHALWPLLLGALLFFVSDAILGNSLFRRNKWRYVSEVVWLTYIAGQALIVWSNLFGWQIIQ